MKNNFFNKLRKVFIFGLLLIIAVCVLIGCGTLSGGEGGDTGAGDYGTLTITGIPAEYAGKFLAFSFDMQRNAPVRIIASGRDPRPFLASVENALINNGEVKLLLFQERPFIGGYTGYTGSDTISVQLVISNTKMRSTETNEPDFIFESVKFENGVANMEWDDGFKINSVVTVTGIPPEYNNRDIVIGIGFSQSTQDLESGHYLMRGGSTTNSGGIIVSGTVRNGAITTRIYPRSNGRYMQYTFTGTKDIMVLLDNGKERPKDLVGGLLSSISIVGNDPFTDYFLFASSSITDGKVTLDFRRGVRK